MRDLTKEEKSAISRLNSLAKVWPESLWLFSASGTLHVMIKDDNDDKVFIAQFRGDGIDSSYSIDTIDIENDGGDW